MSANRFEVITARRWKGVLRLIFEGELRGRRPAGVHAAAPVRHSAMVSIVAAVMVAAYVFLFSGCNADRWF